MKKPMHLKLAAVACAVGLMTAACSTDTGVEGPAHLRMVMFSSNPAHVDLMNEIADDFVATHDNVEDVTFESVTSNDLITVLTTQLASDDAPDLAWMPEGPSRTFVESGALLDVLPRVQDDPDYNFADLIPRVQVLWQHEGGQYGIPFSTSTQGMYYNADLFEAANVNNPDEMIAAGTWDWEHFREAAKEISDSQDVPGYVVDSFDFQHWNRLTPLWYAYGAQPWNDEATQCTLNTPEMTEAMAMFHDMTFKDRSAPLPGQQADFWGGQAAATNSFISSNGLLEDASFDWGFAQMPAGSAGYNPALYQSAFVAFTKSNYPDEALDLLAFMTNEENAKKLAQFFPPARESLLNAETLKEASPLLSEQQLTDVVIDGVRNGEYIPVSRNVGEVSAMFDSSLDANLFNPDADIPAALEAVCADLDPLLADE